MAHDTRAVKRDKYDDHTRLTLLEDDADGHERDIRTLTGKLDSIRNWLVTGTITLGGGAILLGINVALQVGRR